MHAYFQNAARCRGVAAGLSTLVYWHASKHGSKHATAWGVLTFLAVGLFLPLYFLHYFATRRRF